MKKNVIPLAALLALVSLFTGCAATGQAGAPAKNVLSHWPAPADPVAVGTRVAENFLARDFRTNKPNGFIVYPEVCAGFGAMRFAAATGNAELKQKLIDRFAVVLRPENKILIPAGGHVDLSVFGVVPLEIYLLNGDTNFLTLGLSLADRQWDSPLKTGLTRETRWWVDDCWMVGSLQIQAYRATKDSKYADRVATQLAAYLDKLQETNGLFHHGPEAPFYWGRGNGWVAASLAEVLQSLPPDHPQYARLMAGYKKMMAGLQAVQGADGLWHQLLDDPQSFEETSSTGMFTYAMIVGVKNGWLDAAEYGDCARRGWIALCGRIDGQGNLHDICVGTNQSKDKQFYLDRPRSIGDLHGQAPLLWCAWALVDK